MKKTPYGEGGGEEYILPLYILPSHLSVSPPITLKWNTFIWGKSEKSRQTLNSEEKKPAVKGDGKCVGLDLCHTDACELRLLHGWDGRGRRGLSVYTSPHSAAYLKHTNILPILLKPC